MNEIFNNQGKDNSDSQFWVLECDQAKDYKHYFPAKNPQVLGMSFYQASLGKTLKKLKRKDSPKL